MPDISGEVTDTNGNGIGGAVVTAFKEADLTQDVASTTTNTDGTYTLTVPTTGEYHAQVEFEDSDGNLFNALSKHSINVQGTKETLNFTTTTDWDSNTQEDESIVHSGIDDHPFDSVQVGYDYGSLIEDLLIYYNTDDSGSTGLTDSALDNDGTINGASYTDNARVGSHSLSFTQSNSEYVSINNDNDIKLTTGDWKSIAMWINTSQTDDVALYGGYDGSGGVIWLNEFLGNTTSSGQVVLNLREGSAAERAYGSTEVNDGNWHHIVCISPPDNQAENFEIYVDGVDDNATVDSQDGASGEFTENNTYRLGARSDDQWYYNGLMDEVRLFNRRLSDSEIQALYNLSVPSVIQDGDLA